MNLRKKILVIIGITLAFIITILYITSETIIMGSFAELEEQTVYQNVDRILKALSDDLANMNSTANDWAAWDETYQFVEDSNPQYIESNLIDSTLTNLRLSIMLFVHSSGKIVFRKAVDLQNEIEMSFPQSLEQHISDNNFLLRHNDTESSITGLILLPEGTLLVVSRPIVTSFDEGPIHGTLIIGRYLDSAEIARLEEMTQVAFTVCRVDDSMLPDFETAFSSLSPSSDSIFVQPGEEDVAGYTFMKDVYGKPVLMMKAVMPRDIYKQGLATMRYFTASLHLAGLVVGVLAVLLLENQILSRITRLSKSIRGITESGDLSGRISIRGRDELSRLTEDINCMIETAEHSTQELRESQEQLAETNRALEESLKEKEVLLREIYHRVKNNMQIISSLLSLQSSYIKDEKMLDIFRDSQNRVKSMALVHEKLYQSENLARIDFDKYINSLMRDLFQSYGTNAGRVTLKLEVEDISLGIDMAVPCGLVINELVSNSLKHAFTDGREGEIKIVFRAVGEEIELIVSDNGVGIPENIDVRDTGSFGLHLVTILVEDQLEGSIELKRERGTEFRIRFRR